MSRPRPTGFQRLEHGFEHDSVALPITRGLRLENMQGDHLITIPWPELHKLLENPEVQARLDEARRS